MSSLKKNKEPTSFIFTLVFQLKVIVMAKESRASMVTPGADWSNNDNQLQFPLTLTPRGAASFFIVSYCERYFDRDPLSGN